MNDDFLYWSLRSEQAAIQAINARCRRSRLAHRTMAAMYVRKALAALEHGAAEPWAGR